MTRRKSRMFNLKPIRKREKKTKAKKRYKTKNRKHSEKQIQNEVATRNINISVTRVTYQSTYEYVN